MSGKRIRTLTLKGMAAYEEKCAEYTKRLQKLWDSVLRIIDEKDKILSDSSVTLLKQLETDVNRSYEEYSSLAQTYSDFLTATNTESSLAEESNHQTRLECNKAQVVEFCQLITQLKGKLLENLINRSHKSQRQSERSKASKGTSQLLATKYAEAEAARVRVQFVTKEAEILKLKAKLEESEKITLAAATRQKIELDADLNVLSKQKEAATAAAEADALEKFSSRDSDSSTSIHVEDHVLLKHLPAIDPKDRVKDYVNQIHVDQGQNDFKVSVKRPKETRSGVPFDSNSTTAAQKCHQLENVNDSFIDTGKPQTGLASDLSKFLLRKDLTLSRLTPFLDKAECYLSWKASFRQVSNEIGVTPSEEIDLLIKWLGHESRKYAVSLRTAYRKDPEKGLLKIWERLDERYGKAEIVHKSLMNKLEKFPRLNMKDGAKWYELADILAEIEALKEDSEYSVALSYFDSSIGVSQIVAKLPQNIQERWVNKASAYKKSEGVAFPPFSEFREFITDQARIRNDPSFQLHHENLQRNVSNQPARSSQLPLHGERNMISARTTNIAPQSSFRNSETSEKLCPLHKKNHSLNECRGFKFKSISERKQFLKENKICFKCCDSNKHKANECKVSVKCDDCGSLKHASAMHFRKSEKNGGEAEETTVKETVNSTCTQICGGGHGKSCAKLFLTNVYCNDNPQNTIKCYTILDEQSNRSLGSPKLFTSLGIDSEDYEYTLNSCAGTLITSGRKADNCVVESVDGTVRYSLPLITECSDIPNNKSEICTPDIARLHSHLYNIADKIPKFDENADILLLLGRDVIDAHHVLEQVIGPPGAPFAQRLGLGWVVVGELCLGEIHAQDVVNVNKTYLLSNGRTSLFKPCDSKLHVTDVDQESYVYDSVFVKTVNDNKPSLSVEDREFLHIMDRDFHKNASGRWIAPLPFKSPRQRLPNNRELAWKRAQILDTSLHKNPVKKQHFVDFMSKIFQKGHAEVAPPLEPGEECWYLPIFGVYHPQKPDQIRGVFDSSAKFQNISLNSVLLRGPDLTNNLLGILMRFRKESVAITTDIEQMFYCFLVEEKHRNFLRFFWYVDNDPNKGLIEYRMQVHVFGNSPSPAIATYGLHKSVEQCDQDVQDFVTNDFYVDDGLVSKPSAKMVVDLLLKTQNALAEHGLRLHKVTSNSAEVMKSFPSEDLAKDVKNLDLDNDHLPLQRSLGIGWDLELDSFVFKVESFSHPLTRRGILATVNSIFDPLGYLAPVTIVGKLILRDIIAIDNNWDSPLSPDIEANWVEWKESLLNLGEIKIPRNYFSHSCSSMSEIELVVFSDASELAISAVAYLVGKTLDGENQVSFVFGKSKVAPARGHTMPRLELCGAVLAVEVAETVTDHIHVNPSLTDIRFYTDSKVVLGYINNQSRRFFTYVSNRVQRIRLSSSPSQWHYATSDSNPADIGSRGATPFQLQNSTWLRGPKFLTSQSLDIPEFFPLLDPEEDTEVRPQVVAKATKVVELLGCVRFECFSSWEKLVSAVASLRHIVVAYHQKLPCKGWHLCELAKTVESKQVAETVILKEVQHESYAKKIICLRENRGLDKNSPILSLDPFLDKKGLLRVGGRLSRSELSSKEKHPVALPGRHHVSKLVAYHFHESVQHQGRLFTEGAIRAAGYWITGGKRLVSSLIFGCVKCKKLRVVLKCRKCQTCPLIEWFKLLHFHM